MVLTLSAHRRPGEHNFDCTGFDRTETLVLTDAAAAKVTELLEEEGNPELFPRVAVRPGGCSGFSYEMFFDTELPTTTCSPAPAVSRWSSTPPAPLC